MVDGDPVISVATLVARLDEVTPQPVVAFAPDEGVEEAVGIEIDEDVIAISAVQRIGAP